MKVLSGLRWLRGGSAVIKKISESFYRHKHRYLSRFLIKPDPATPLFVLRWKTWLMLVD